MFVTYTNHPLWNPTFTNRIKPIKIYLSRTNFHRSILLAIFYRAIVLFHLLPKFVVEEGATVWFRVPRTHGLRSNIAPLQKRLNDSSKVTWWRVRFTNERTRIRMRVTHTHPSKTCFTLVARNLDASLNTWLVIIICRTWHSSFRVDVHYIGVTANWKFPRFWCWYVDESCIRRGICFDVWFWFFSIFSEYLKNNLTETNLTEGLILYIVHNEIIR